jgi:hypothetical protein
MRYSKKQSKDKKKQRIEGLMSGEGVFIYENNTDADLSLPKMSLDGQKTIGPRKRFKGDSYFMSLVKTPVCLLRLIEEIKEPKEETKEEFNIQKSEKSQEIKEKKIVKTINKKGKKKKKKVTKDKKMKEKLILDQPEVVTKAGKLEQVDLEEKKEVTESEEKLLTENPFGDIQIISE